MPLIYFRPYALGFPRKRGKMLCIGNAVSVRQIRQVVCDSTTAPASVPAQSPLAGPSGPPGLRSPVAFPPAASADRATG